MESFRKASGAGIENSGIHLMWGQGLLQTLDPKGSEDDNAKKKGDAVAQFRKTTALDPNLAAGHFWLGTSLVLSRREGDTDGNKKLVEEACAEFGKCLRLEPKNEDARKAKERIGCK